jgi:hypothetical protein
MKNLDLNKVDEKVNDPSKVVHDASNMIKNDQSLLSKISNKEIQSSWRRVEDELPERNEVVLVCFKNGYDNSQIRAMGYRTFDPGICYWSTDLVFEEPDGYAVDDIKVTHWMPLPDPPL